MELEHEDKNWPFDQGGTTDEVARLRKQMWTAEFRPIPVRNADDSGPSPGKRPDGANWQVLARQNPPYAVEAPVSPAALNTGLLCDGLRPLDIDVEDEATAARIRMLALDMLGPGPVKTRSNSVKCTILYRAAEGEPRKLHRTGASHDSKTAGASMKIEVLGWGNQMVAYGLHETGVAIQWENNMGPGTGVVLADLAPVTEEQVERFLDAAGELIGATTQTRQMSLDETSVHPPRMQHHGAEAEPSDVARALNVIPNDGPADWNDWKRIGLAAYAATGGSWDGFDAFDSWSRKNPAYDARKTQQAWEEMRRSPPSNIGAGTLFFLARQARPDWQPSERLRDNASVATQSRLEMRLPQGFSLASDGVWFVDPHPKKEGDAEERWVCGPLKIIGECRDTNSYGWGVVVGWTDNSSVPHEAIVARRQLPSPDGGSSIAAMLEDGGLRCGDSRLLRKFFQGLHTDRKLRLVPTTGWHQDDAGYVYALPTGEVFGPTEHNVILDPQSRRVGDEVGQAGTLDEWQDQVAQYAVNNSRVAFFMSAAFAGTLLNVNAEPSGGIHLVGKSRSGKSTSLFAAASVWGKGTRKVMQWRATSNGLEAIAKASSDGVILLDEIGQANGKEAGDAIYMLANEGGKQRANVHGGARERVSWRAIMLSTGEIGLESKMNEANRSMATGLHVRLVNVEADAGVGLGAFEHLHDKASPAALADHLREASGRHYGVAIRKFLEDVSHLRANGDTELRDLVEGFRQQFREANVPPGADGQVESVAGRFSLIAAAGELATALGILPWPKDEALRAAGKCFAVWLSARGHSGAGEDEAAIKHVRRFVLSHGMTRFAPSDVPNEVIRDRIGWRRETQTGSAYLFHKDLWDQEVFKGAMIDPRRALEALNRANLLETNEGRLTFRMSIGGQKIRVVWVRPTIIED